jgi:UDP-N-acetyl-D-mannosaminuronic acid dehydrogenase
VSTVCIHGLGKIGLPTAAVVAAAGHNVAGYDADPAVRGRLRRRDLDVAEPPLDRLVRRTLDSGQLEVVDEPPTATYHVVCVPTSIDRQSHTADLRHVTAAGETIADRLRRGDAVILESTVPPGTTTGELAPILETADLEIGRDIRLAYSPETVLPGDIVAELRGNDRIVGGVDRRSVAAAERLYESFVTGTIRTAPDPTVAEFVKLIQNASRDVEIAVANEVAKIADDYGIDARAAIQLANSHPRVDILNPGPGVGGHCLPVDPWFLGQDSEHLDLLSTARRVNDGMPRYAVGLLRGALGDLTDRKVAVLGVAYKGNVRDTRNSPGLQLARELEAARGDATRMTADGGTIAGTEVAICDPHITDDALELSDLATATAGADAMVIATDHDEFHDLDPRACRERMAGHVVLDTKDVVNPEKWGDYGFDVHRI